MSVALVTGGCRRLGAAIAGRLAEAGYDLALHAGHEATPEPALVERIARAGRRWQAFVADLADPAAPARLLGAVEGAFGAPVALLVNNAARFVADDAASATAATLNDHLGVNLVAPILLSLAAARRAAADFPVAIVNILDERIANPHRDQLSYTLSKQALGEATRTLARALAPHVRVNGVAPGLTMPTAAYGAAQLERLAAMMPLARLSRPADVAEAVAYLARAEASTGQILFVDGGAGITAFDRDFVHLGHPRG